MAIVRPRVGLHRADLAAVAAVGVLDGAANALFAFALTQGLTSTVSVLGSLYPVTTVVLAVLLLDERIARRGRPRTDDRARRHRARQRASVGLWIWYRSV